MTQTSNIVLAALFTASTSAISLTYRPPAGSVPWQIPVTVPEFEEPGHPVNYFVPDFGVDSDIINATDAIKQSEKTLKKTMHADFGATKNPVNPREYFVPDFGVDQDIIASTNSIAQSEVAVGSKLNASFADSKNPVNPRNYFVPDFGVDHDILHVEHAIDISEKKLNHKLEASFDATKNPVNPRNYFVPDFGVDHGILETNASLQQSETVLKHKWSPVKDGDHWANMPAADANSAYVFSNTSPEFSAATKTDGSSAFVAVSKGPPAAANVQLDSDPICSSAGCDQYKQKAGPPGHPMDYFVPNFGVDHHIEESQASEKWASAETGHQWDFKFEKKPDVVQYQTNPLDVDMQSSLSNLKEQEAIHGNWDIQDVMLDMQSDPICSSAGCTQYKHDEEPGHPMDYFVPDFGVDHDIRDSNIGLKVAEKTVGHNWDFKFEKKPAWEAGFKVPDFGVDQDIIGVQDGLKWAQSELGHKWEPTQDSNGYWNVPEAASNASYSYNGNSGFTDHLVAGGGK